MPSLMESIIALDVGAQEPWPNDVQLFQPYPIEQILLTDNANCLATQAFLHMCGLPFQIEHRANAEFMSPSGKVPFIKCGAFIIPELEPIVQFVSNKGISLTADLDNDQKSDLRAYMSLIYSVLMNAELYICWCDKKTYNEVTKVRNGSVYPWPLNYFQTWSKKSGVTRKLKTLGWYQKTLGSVYQEVENCCQALSERLEGKEYFFGSNPTELDAVLYGHTFSILSNPINFPVMFLIFQHFPNLINHCKRICYNYTKRNCVDIGLNSTPEIKQRSVNVQSNKLLSLLRRIWNFITVHMIDKLATFEVIDDDPEEDINKVEIKIKNDNETNLQNNINKDENIYETETNYENETIFYEISVDVNETCIDYNETCIDCNETGNDDNGICDDENGIYFDDNATCNDVDQIYIDDNVTCDDVNEVYFDDNATCDDVNGIYFDENATCNDANEIYVDDTATCNDVTKIKDYEIYVDDNATCNEVNEIYVYDNETGNDVNEICFDGNETCDDVLNELYVDDSETCADVNEMYDDDNKIYVEDNETCADVNEIYVEDNETCVDINETYFDDNATCNDVNEICFDDNEIYGDDNKICVDDNEICVDVNKICDDVRTIDETNNSNENIYSKNNFDYTRSSTVNKSNNNSFRYRTKYNRKSLYRQKKLRKRSLTLSFINRQKESYHECINNNNNKNLEIKFDDVEDEGHLENEYKKTESSPRFDNQNDLKADNLQCNKINEGENVNNQEISKEEICEMPQNNEDIIKNNSEVSRKPRIFLRCRRLLKPQTSNIKPENSNINILKDQDSRTAPLLGFKPSKTNIRTLSMQNSAVNMNISTNASPNNVSIEVPSAVHIHVIDNGTEGIETEVAESNAASSDASSDSFSADSKYEDISITDSDLLSS